MNSTNLRRPLRLVLDIQATRAGSPIPLVLSTMPINLIFNRGANRLTENSRIVQFSVLGKAAD